MARKRYTTEQIIGHLREAEVRLAQGQVVGVVCRGLGINARLLVISNHPHFVHIKPDDRRYLVLESSPVWKGTSRFDQLLEQWANGGAARFVHDALNHSFRRVDGCKSLVISRNITTPFAVRQMAQSRSPLEKCIVEFMLTGSFKCPRMFEEYRSRHCGIRTRALWFPPWD